MFYYLDNSNKTEETVNSETSKATEIHESLYSGNLNITKVSATYAISIGEKAFENCLNLKEIFLGPDIRKIGAQAFINCSNLTDVWFPMLDRKAKVEISPNAFEKCGKICFHVFGLGCSTCGNEDIENYAKAHKFDLMGMI